MSSPRSIIHLTRAFVRDPRLRRSMMFYTSLGSVLMLFIGAVPLDGTLRNRPVIFVLWWGACAWLMLASLLLALFDMLAIRASARRERRELARRILEEKQSDEESR